MRHRHVEPILDGGDTTTDRDTVAAIEGIAPEVVAAGRLADVLADRVTLHTLAEDRGKAEGLIEVAKLARNLAEGGHKHADRLREIADEAVALALPYDVLDAVGRVVSVDCPRLWPTLCWAILQSPTLAEVWRDTYAPTMVELRGLAALDDAAYAILTASARGDAALDGRPLVQVKDGEG